MFHVAGGIILFLLIVMFLPLIEKVILFCIKAIPVIIIMLILLVFLTRS